VLCIYMYIDVCVVKANTHTFINDPISQMFAKTQKDKPLFFANGFSGSIDFH
jgi:hypothetical protein